jgi:hypothetical protein
MATGRVNQNLNSSIKISGIQHVCEVSMIIGFHGCTVDALFPNDPFEIYGLHPTLQRYRSLRIRMIVSLIH